MQVDQSVKSVACEPNKLAPLTNQSKKKDLHSLTVKNKQPDKKQRSLDSFFVAEAPNKETEPQGPTEAIPERRITRRQSDGDAFLDKKRPLEEMGVSSLLIWI